MLQLVKVLSHALGYEGTAGRNKRGLFSFSTYCVLERKQFFSVLVAASPVPLYLPDRVHDACAHRFIREDRQVSGHGRNRYALLLEKFHCGECLVLELLQP